MAPLDDWLVNLYGGGGPGGVMPGAPPMGMGVPMGQPNPVQGLAQLPPQVLQMIHGMLQQQQAGVYPQAGGYPQGPPGVAPQAGQGYWRGGGPPQASNDWSRAMQQAIGALGGGQKPQGYSDMRDNPYFDRNVPPPSGPVSGRSGTRGWSVSGPMGFPGGGDTSAPVGDQGWVPRGGGVAGGGPDGGGRWRRRGQIMLPSPTQSGEPTQGDMDYGSPDKPRWHPQPDDTPPWIFNGGPDAPVIYDGGPGGISGRPIQIEAGPPEESPAPEAAQAVDDIYAQMQRRPRGGRRMAEMYGEP